MELIDTIYQRRSIRKYSGEALPEGALDAIVEAGLLAPSSRNLKVTQLLTVTDPDTLAFLSTAKSAGGSMLKNAEAAVVVMGDSVTSDAWIEDGSIAMAHMMLRATDLGLGSCWVQIRGRCADKECTVPAQDAIRHRLGIPEEFSILAILSLGVPAEFPAAHTRTDADTGRVYREVFSRPGR